MMYTRTGASWLADEEPFLEKAADPAMPWLISYPRTGSHWLRMVLEHATGRPLLRRTFFEPVPGAEPLLIHDHNRVAEPEVCPRNTIFLYRAAPETVFSLTNYWMGFAQEDAGIVQYTRDYMVHLRKWLVEERFIARKTVIRYRELSTPAGVRKALDHLGEDPSPERLAESMALITKDEISRRTKDQEKSVFRNRIIAPEADYEERRARFLIDKSALVWNTIKEDPAIAAWFDELS